MTVGVTTTIAGGGAIIAAPSVTHERRTPQNVPSDENGPVITRQRHPQMCQELQQHHDPRM